MNPLLTAAQEGIQMVEEQKHSPAPWRVEGMYIKDACGCYVADIKLDDEDPQPHADARLIAAAPDLLEALRVAQAEIKYLRKHAGDVPAGHWLALVGVDDQIGAALSKAGA